jgi:hypothetical protein
MADVVHEAQRRQPWNRATEWVENKAAARLSALRTADLLETQAAHSLALVWQQD